MSERLRDKCKMAIGDICYKICTCPSCPGIHRAHVIELYDHGYRVELLDPEPDDPEYVISKSIMIPKRLGATSVSVWPTAQDALAYAVKRCAPARIASYRKTVEVLEEWLALSNSLFADSIAKGVATIFEQTKDEGGSK